MLFGYLHVVVDRVSGQRIQLQSMNYAEITQKQRHTESVPNVVQLQSTNYTETKTYRISIECCSIAINDLRRNKDIPNQCRVLFKRHARYAKSQRRRRVRSCSRHAHRGHGLGPVAAMMLLLIGRRLRKAAAVHPVVGHTTLQLILLLTGGDPAHAGPAGPILHKLHLPRLPPSSSGLPKVLDVPATFPCQMFFFVMESQLSSKILA